MRKPGPCGLSDTPMVPSEVLSSVTKRSDGLQAEEGSGHSCYPLGAGLGCERQEEETRGAE